MSLREFDAIVTIRLERERVEYENALWYTALQVSGFRNTVYGALMGKKHKPLHARVLFDAWTGKHDPKARLNRIQKALARHEARLVREKNRRVL